MCHAPAAVMGSRSSLPHCAGTVFPELPVAVTAPGKPGMVTFSLTWLEQGKGDEM